MTILHRMAKRDNLCGSVSKTVDFPGRIARNPGVGTRGGPLVRRTGTQSGRLDPARPDATVLAGRLGAGTGMARFLNVRRDAV